MSKKNYIIVALMFAATYFYAQTTVGDKNNDAELVASNASNLPTTTVISGTVTNLQQQPSFSAEQARKFVRSSFNLSRDYSVSIDMESLKGTFDPNAPDTDFVKEESKELSIGVLNSLPDDKFDQYIAGMEKVLLRKYEKIQGDTSVAKAQKAEKEAQLLRLQTVLQSSQCLTGRNEGSFIQTLDIEGNAILAFKLDSLRKNTRYGLVENYREGFARIRKDQVYGFLNYCGDEVVPAQYEKAEAFNAGKALVKKVNWYFINGIGEESDALENIVDVRSLAYGVTQVKLTNGRFALINNNYDVTKKTISESYESIESFNSNKVYKVRDAKKIGLINVDGTVKLPIIYDVIEPIYVSKSYKVKVNEKWGIIDSLGNIKFKPEFDAIAEFNEFGIANVFDEKGVRLLNAKTNVVTRAYNSIGKFNQFGVAAIRDVETKLFGLMDKDLKVIVKPNYFSLGDFNQFGLAEACVFGKQCGFINAIGTEVIAPNFTAVSSFNALGMCVVKATEKNCTQNCDYELVMNKEGKVIVPKATKEAHKISYSVEDSLFSNDFISVRVTHDNDGAGFVLINKDRLKAINSVAYKAIHPVDIYGMIRVEDLENRWGMIDTTGKVIAKCLYKDMRRPSENYYPTKNDDGKWGYIDKKGKPQIPFEYDEVRNFRNGYAIVSKGKDKTGIISKFNAKVVPCTFRTAAIDENRKYTLVDIDGITEVMLNDKLDCEKGCDRLEEKRKAVNNQ